MTLPVFLADDDPAVLGAAVGSELLLGGPEGRHAAAVRRMVIGEQLLLGDGQGRALRATVIEAMRDALRLRVDEVLVQSAPEPRIVVVQALPKGDRGELAVELMTEVGVDVIVPWAAARCITRWRDARGDKALARWRSTAREAGKQARRLRLPEVRPLATTADIERLITTTRTPDGGAWVLQEDAAAPLAGLEPPTQGDLVLVVGPEGGITDDELSTFTTAGASAVRLGPSVLRTSTAGAAATAVVLSRTARWA